MRTLTRGAKQMVRKRNPKSPQITTVIITEKPLQIPPRIIQKLLRFKSLTTFMSEHVVAKPLIAIA